MKYLITAVLYLLLVCSCTQKHSHENCDHDHSGHTETASKTTASHKHEEQEHDHDHGEEHNHDHADGECDHNHDHEENNKAGESHTDEVEFSPEKAKEAGIVVEKVQKGIFHQIIKTSGKIQNTSSNEQTITANVAGIVSFSQPLTEGQAIRKGSKLFTLSSEYLSEGDPVQKARIAYEIAQKEYERAASLVEDKIVSEKEYNEAKQTYETARIGYEKLASRSTGKGQVIPASANGFIKEILVKEGDYVEIGTPLATTTQSNRLYLRAEVPEKYYKDLRLIHSANFRTTSSDTSYELNKLNGKLLSYGKTTGDNSFYIPVIFEFDNQNELIPGSFAEIFLLSAPVDNAISLPLSALVEEQGYFFVYIQVHEDAYKKREVTLGANDGNNVQILSGISEGETVVSKGAYHLKLATASNAMPAHSHDH